MSADSASQSLIFTVINSLVLLSTLIRLSYRWHTRRLWWEDAWAAASFVSGMVFVITQYISVETSNPDTGNMTALISSVSSTVAMCAVRMSILYSTIRIISPSRILTFARIVAIFLVIFCAIIVALRSSLCVPPKGTQLVTQKCIDGIALVVFQVTTDCISDAILVILPLKLLWRVKLPPRQRQMILTLFSSSAIVSIFSLVHGIIPNNNNSTPRGSIPNNSIPSNNISNNNSPNDNFVFNLTLNLETTSALIVCNLLVLVTCLDRLFRKPRREPALTERDHSLADDDFTTRILERRTTVALTTLDLDIDYSYCTSGVSSSSQSQFSAPAEKN